MFDESLIVQSAISAFNNAALFDPAFFWLGLLMLPLFVITRKYSDKIVAIFGWKRENLLQHTQKFVIIFSIAWILLFGGNYSVMRDNVSLVPILTAFIGFTGMLFLGTYTKHLSISDWKSLSKNKKIKYGFIALAFVAIIGLSDTHTWWGPILQIFAFIGGLYMGHRTKKIPNGMNISIGIMFATTTAILMQPEMFRFGQLGNLTILHLLGVLSVGLTCVPILLLKNVKTKNKIYESAFIKLKWLLRCLTVLSIILFILTESVIVFLGICALFACMCYLSINHAKLLSVNLYEQIFYLSLCCFGILTVMPVITCLGILGWETIQHNNFIKDVKFLL